MKFLFKTTSFLLMALMAFGMTACHDGSKEPESDQEKTLDHLIFEEICYVGTEKTYDGKHWNPYGYDQYIKITNPTSEPVYLDGMGLALSGLSAKTPVNIAEGTDFRATHFVAGKLMLFPGIPGEKKRVLEPGKSIFIAAMAHNHTINPIPEGVDEEVYEGPSMWNEDSYDLSNIDYQWMNEIQVNATGEFVYNPNVPSLIGIMGGGDPTVFPGNGYAIALIKFPDGTNVQKIWEEYGFKTSHTTNDTGNHGHGAGKEFEQLKFPNNIVEDAVLICKKKDYAWSIIPGLDEGYASTQELELAEYECLSLYRKHDGIKFVDDNNSTTDFEVRAASKWLSNPKGNKAN